MDGETKAIIESINAEDKRQNHRIDSLEAEVKSFHSIAMSVERLAINMENMLKEQTKQGARLDSLENAPINDMKNIKSTAISTIVSAIVGAIIGAIITKISIGG